MGYVDGVCCWSVLMGRVDGVLSLVLLLGYVGVCWGMLGCVCVGVIFVKSKNYLKLLDKRNLTLKNYSTLLVCSLFFRSSPTYWNICFTVSNITFVSCATFSTSG